MKDGAGRMEQRWRLQEGRVREEQRGRREWSYTPTLSEREYKTTTTDRLGDFYLLNIYLGAGPNIPVYFCLKLQTLLLQEPIIFHLLV
jgi:hypothetical protein